MGLIRIHTTQNNRVHYSVGYAVQCSQYLFSLYGSLFSIFSYLEHHTIKSWYHKHSSYFVSQKPTFHQLNPKNSQFDDWHELFNQIPHAKWTHDLKHSIKVHKTEQNKETWRHLLTNTSTITKYPHKNLRNFRETSRCRTLLPIYQIIEKQKTHFSEKTTISHIFLFKYSCELHNHVVVDDLMEMRQ